MKNPVRLQSLYNEEARQKMMDMFQYSNVHMIPDFTKIVINMGLGAEAIDNANNLTDRKSVV